MPVKTREQVQNEVELSSRLEETVEIEAKVDEYGEIQAEVDELNLKAEKKIAKIYEEIGERRGRLDKLETDILVPAVRNVDATKGTEVHGTVYTATIGKEKKVRKVKDPLRAFMFLTGAELLAHKEKDSTVSVSVEALKTFLDIVGIPLGQLDDYLSKPERDQVLEESTGGIDTRRFKVAPRK